MVLRKLAPGHMIATGNGQYGAKDSRPDHKSRTPNTRLPFVLIVLCGP